MFEEKTVRAHQDALFRQITSYLPIRGQRIQISPALADAFFLHLAVGATPPADDAPPLHREDRRA